MVGFGLMDNLVMIQAGDFIDNNIGVAFGLSTLTAAAYGQVVSDVSGTLFGGVVESMAAALGLPKAGLTAEQLGLRNVRMVGTGSAAAGVVLGCLLGMLSLLFMDLQKAERARRQRELRTLFATLLEDGHEIIECQHCTLFLVDADGEHLFSMGQRGDRLSAAELEEAFHRYDASNSGAVDASELQAALRKLGCRKDLREIGQLIAAFDETKTGTLSPAAFSAMLQSSALSDEFKLPIRDGGTHHRVLTSGRPLSVREPRRDARVAYPELYQLRGYHVHSLLLGPVFDDEGKVVGIVELVNKKGADGLSAKGFGVEDEKMLAMLCRHCSVFLKHVNGGDGDD